jgi:hypothetical protein
VGANTPEVVGLVRAFHGSLSSWGASGRLVPSPGRRKKALGLDLVKRTRREHAESMSISTRGGPRDRASPGPQALDVHGEFRGVSHVTQALRAPRSGSPNTG